MDYKKEYYKVKRDFDELNDKYCKLKIRYETEVKMLKEEIHLLNEKIDLLMKVIQTKPPQKNSSNSSIPPSSDLSRKNKSTREKSTKKSGGQPGHKGSTLLQTQNPDTIIDLKSDYCGVCGQSLSNQKYKLKSKRQTIDIPPIKPICHEYRQYSCTCPNCQHEQIGDYPQNVSAPIQYGVRIQTLVSYLSVYQCIPFARLASMFSDLFNVSLSEGSIKNILVSISDKAGSVHNRIKEEIRKSGIVGSDETGARENGKKMWIWTWQNLLNTYIISSDSRGFQTIKEEWTNGLPASVLVSDRLSAQLKTPAKDHQICLAHLLREVTYLEEFENHPFSSKFKAFINDIFVFKKHQDRDYKSSDQEIIAFENKLNKLLSITISSNEYSKTATFQKSILKVRNYILPCIYSKEIPPDNNGSERAIRNIKVKQKVSGQFKSGSQIFCILRSIIDTCKKRKQNILDILAQIIYCKNRTRLQME
jgi:transposase